MKISLQWLRDYIPSLSQSPTEIAQLLTSIGLEVEHIETIAPVSGKVVVGEIITAEKHPQADTLQICQVNIGEAHPLSIVCGAKNARQGLRVVVATIGSILPKDFKIKEAKIRGIPSFGMLCSEEELELAEKSDGIIELATNIKVGLDVNDVLGLKDTVFTLGITPNRGDCLSVIGIARELSAKLNGALQLPETKPKQLGTFSSKDRVTVCNDAKEDCGRFTALAIDQVSTCTSPLWLRQRLIRCGMRPLNLIVDVTNYVMLETGQPIHAYDSRDLAGKMLGVRVALEKESITTLDGQKRELTADDLIIFDAKGPVGIAGIMGGAKSEVKNDTSSIIIEVAHFSASRVRKTAKRFALHSEASHRFERGVDIERLDLVSWRVATLIEQCQTELMKLGTLTIKAPHIGKDLVDLYPEKIRPHRIAMRTERLKQFLNYPIDQTESSHILQRLGIECIDRTDGRAVYQIPSWRHDLEREVDLIEEVARLRGYEKISNTMPLMEIGPNYEDGMIDFVDDVKVATAIAGFTEVVNFPFMHSGDLTHLRLESEHPYRNSVRIANPLAEQDSLLVTSLLPLLLKAAQRNLRVGDTGVALFEVGRQFLDLQTKNSTSAAPELAHCYALGRHISEQAKADQRVIERQVIAGIMTSPIVAKAWNNSSEEAASIYHMKATLECLALALGIPKHKMTVQPIREATYPWLHPGAAASVMWNNQHIGSFGEIHPETAKAYGFSTNDAPVVFEFDLELMYLSRTALKDISLSAYRFPGSSRDLAFIADVGLHHEQVISVINSFTKKKYLSRSHLFDIYTGTPIASGKKSMAYAFFFQSPDKTLTDKEVDDEFLQLTNWLKSNLAIELRT